MDPPTANDTNEEPYPGHDETNYKYMDMAKEIHAKYPLIDGHNDLPYAVRCCFDMKWSQLNLGKNHTGMKVDGCPWEALHTDIPRLQQGGVGGQFWSVYIPTAGGYNNNNIQDGVPVVDPATAIAFTLEQIDIVHRMCEIYPNQFELVDKADDILRIFHEKKKNSNGGGNNNKIASLIGIEGGHQIGGSLRALRMFYKLGVRYMTLTHNGGPGWADPACNIDGSWLKTPTIENGAGLDAEFGVAVVTEMNRIGMMIDLSHVHHQTMHTTLDVTMAPVIFSHSSTRALCRHPRDVPDDVLVRLKQNGGLCMIVFLSKFVAGEFWVAGGKVGATILEVADHVDRVVEIAGIDHVGIGGDYDGGDVFARGLEDVSKYPSLTCELLKRGYNEEQLSKILGLNIIRVLKKCEDISREMKSQPIKYPIGEAHWGDELYETNKMKEDKLFKN